jgi:ribosomal protein S18 acetylase RimI-like enzyme
VPSWPAPTGGRACRPRPGARGAPPRPRAATAPLRARRHLEAARVDRAAFGDPWGNDAGDLAEIRRATPVHRARARFINTSGRRQLVAFAITGSAAGHGYLQRLAVAPAHQGRGHGRALTLDSLAWMRSRRLTYGLVNTAVDNHRALALYESVGFRRLPDELLVMQLDTR